MSFLEFHLFLYLFFLLFVHPNMFHHYLIQIYYVGLDGYVSIYDYFIMVLSPKDISEKIIYIVVAAII